jgi:hypothetical protein
MMFFLFTDFEYWICYTELIFDDFLNDGCNYFEFNTIAEFFSLFHRCLIG